MSILVDALFYLRLSLFTLIFVGSGVVICLLSLISYCVLSFVAPTLNLLVVHYLYELFLSVITSITQLVISCQIEIFGDANIPAIMNSGHNMIVMNHKYESDFALFLAMCDRMGCLKTMKCHMKRSLLFVPFLGFICHITDNIFIHRSWLQDSQTIKNKISDLCRYESVPVNLTLMPEGTRFTQEKQRQSVEFARANQLPQLKHVLLPRPKGYLFATEFLRDKFDYFIDGLHLMSSPDGVTPSFYNIITGTQFKIQFLLKARPFSDLPEDEDERKALLYSSFVEKDEIFDRFNANGGTLEGIYPRIECHPSMLKFWLRNALNVVLASLFYVVVVRSIGDFYMFMGLSAIFVLIIVVLLRFVQVSKPNTVRSGT